MAIVVPALMVLNPNSNVPAVANVNTLDNSPCMVFVPCDTLAGKVMVRPAASTVIRSRIILYVPEGAQVVLSNARVMLPVIDMV